MELRSDGAFLPAEILIRAVRAGHSIAEVPVRHLPRVTGTATGNRIDVIVTGLAEMWRFWREVDATRRTPR
jgi:hypothetical protein